MSIEAMNQAFEVPLVEQLESVPTNARLVIDDADGMGTQYIPVGRMCHDASKALRQAIAEAEKQQRELSLQKLHDENERLGLYKDAYGYEHEESVRLQCTHCGTVYADGVPPQVPEKQEPVACPYCKNDATLGAVYFDQNCVGCVKRMTRPQPKEQA